MITNIGYALLFLQITLAILLPIFCKYYQPKISQQNLNKLTNIFTASLVISAFVNQIALAIAYIICDYTILNVYQNTHHLKPLIYRIAGSWGNHEGSMLLLISVLSFYLFIFDYFSKIESKIKIIAINSQCLIIALFSAYTTFASNPFLPSYSQGFALNRNIEGLGLNPILQDIGLALHPPMLYTGYLGFSIVFCLMISMLINKEFSNKLLTSLSNWLYFAYAFLTLGIMLGAWWAYRELGWGGYWFFDPVENISLMPWLCATALIHSIKFAKDSDSMQFWSAFLAILCFILCLFGIFLTRSGVLTSVHAFAVDMDRSYFIVAIILIISSYGLLVLGYNSDLLSKKNKNIIVKQKIKLFLVIVNNYFLLGSLFVVLLGTLYPIFLRAFGNQFITVGAQYYQQIFSYLLIPFLIFFSLSGYHHQSLDFKKFFKTILSSRFAICFVLSCIAISTAIYKNFDLNFLQLIILFLSFFTLFVTLSTRQKLRVYFAHLGFVILLLGIILSSYFALVKEQNLKVNEQIALGNYQFTFKEVSFYQGKNFIARQGQFIITKDQQTIANVNPQLRFYPVNQQTTNEASIAHLLVGDLYAVIGNKDDLENYAIRIYFKPFVYLIWLGAIIIFLALISKPLMTILKFKLH
ncbi:MAG: heme lyase CcmF/NrfE family subunit [Alphaproteobacteria bacterium]